MASSRDVADTRTVRVDPDRLTRFAAGVLRDLGMSGGDAYIGAKVMVSADLRGVHSHGIRYLPTYVPLFRGGAIRPDASLEIVTESPGAVVVDANAGMGHVMAHRATELAIDRVSNGPARTAAVLVRNSNHFGAAGYYPMMCADAGLVGIVLTNSPPVMSAPGGRGNVISNAPFSYAAPGPGGRHIVFDAALSHVAGSKVMMAEERGEPIPEGWMVNADGLPTTDPSEYRNGGALVPIGDHKGYAIALLVELLSGVLSGAGITHEVLRYREFPESPSRIGHTIIALDVEAFMPLDRFLERVGRLRDEIHATPPAKGARGVRLPGDFQAVHEAESRARGLELDGMIWADLVELAARFDKLPVLEGAMQS